MTSSRLSHRVNSKRRIPTVLASLLAATALVAAAPRGRAATAPPSSPAPAQSAPAPAPLYRVFLAPNFHPACCGWLTDWSTERNYCANNYLDHLDRVRDDPNYAFALSEVPNMIALLNFHPDRIDELKRRIAEGRAELVNAFFLECTINLPGGEALVRNGIEGLRWQRAVFGVRPRFAWIIDVTGTHEQMAQITAGLGLEAMVYTRHNPTGSALHWAVSPDGTRALAISPGHYSEWNPVFTAKEPLGQKELLALKTDLDDRLGRTAPKIDKPVWDGPTPPAPAGAPVIILAGNGDYSVAPARREYPAEFLRQFAAVAPDVDLRFATPGAYLDAVKPLVAAGAVRLPTMEGGTKFSFNAFWIENPRVKTAFRLCEQGLQAAEMLSTIAQLQKGRSYPVRDLRDGWYQLFLDMDRNSLWGSAGGAVFQHAASWDVNDRITSIREIAARVSGEAMETLTGGGGNGGGGGVAFFNPLNWDRDDPVTVSLPEGRVLKDVTCQALPGTPDVLCRPALPSVGTVSLATAEGAAAPSTPAALPGTIETRHYSARIDPATGALVSLRLKPSGREVLGGPANVIVAERPKTQSGDPGDFILDREERIPVATSNRFAPKIEVFTGPLATIVEARSPLLSHCVMVRTMRFYQDVPRIDFETELVDVPDRTVVLAEFPLKDDVVEVRRGIPYGFSHGAWAKPNPALHGWTKGIVPAVRWSHYALAGGGGVALLDRGLSGRELTGRTPVLFLLNATDTYYGWPNEWLSGRGRHVLRYAMVAHEGDWEAARIPRLAWEYGDAPVIAGGRAPEPARSYLRTSENVIVEAVRREGGDIEVRLAESLGRAGDAEVRLDLPHRSAALTDLTGANPKPLPADAGGTYRFPVRPQQIVTMRFATDRPVATVEPLTDWGPLVPGPKQAALRTRIDKKGHPPRGDGKAI